MTRMKDKDSLKSKREAALLEAACRVIHSKGLHQARMADIAKEAGTSYGLAYHYFKNKNDLFEAIIEKWWNGLFGAMALFDTTLESAEEKLAAIVDYFLDQYVNTPDLLHFFNSEISRSTVNLTPERLKDFKRFIASVEAIIKKGQEEGAFTKTVNARYLAYLFLGGLDAVISSMVLDQQLIASERQKNNIADRLLSGFLNGARER